MKKKIIIIFLLLFVFLCSVQAGKILYSNFEKNQDIKKEEKIENNEIESVYIKERGEMDTRALFELENGDASYEINLMENDMMWDTDTRLYYRTITNMEDYNIYKERLYSLPEMSHTDFENNFVIILANENERVQGEIDLIIYDVVDDGTTTHIIVKQRENPREYRENNVFWAIVDKSVLNEQIDVEIQY